jgi:two-component system chemotaxis response regulator CheY
MSYNILMVDDSETARAFMAKTISLSGLPIHDLFQAANGQEALNIAQKEWIDLILCDSGMPVMTGLELIDQLQQQETLRAIPVVLLAPETALGSASPPKGVRACLQKPFTPEILKRTLEDILGGHA